MFPEGLPRCPGAAFFMAVTLAFGAATVAFLGLFGLAIVFLGTAFAATCTAGCAALALGAGLGATVLGFCAAGLVGFVAMAAVSTALVVGVGFLAVAAFGFFIAG